MATKKKGNIKNLVMIDSTERARELQKKSAEARSNNLKEKKIFKEAIAERLGEADFDEIIDNLIKRAKKNDKSLEILRDTLGQRPVDKAETITTTLSYEDYIKKVEDKNEY